MRQFVLFACVVLSLVSSARATTFQVIVQDFSFTPATLTVNQGDTVVWTNVQGAHNVMHACGAPLFGNSVGTAPWVYQFVFDIPAGDYPYWCEVHPNNMMGLITVQRVPQRRDVTVQNFSFTPQNVDVLPGDTIVWHNVDGFHSVRHTGTPTLFTSGDPAFSPWTYTFVVNLAPGTYPYICDVHPTSMMGNVVVGDSPSPPPAPASLVIRRSGDNEILTWSPVAGADCYLVFVSSTSSIPVYTELAGITGDPGFVQPLTALPGTKYFFQVRAVGH